MKSNNEIVRSLLIIVKQLIGKIESKVNNARSMDSKNRKEYSDLSKNIVQLKKLLIKIVADLDREIDDEKKRHR